MNLKQRLFALALVALLPAVATQIYTEVVLRSARQREIIEQAQRAGELAASELQVIFAGVQSLLQAVTAAPVVRGFETERCTAYLTGLKASLPNAVSLAASDLTGTVRCREIPLAEPINVADRPYFRDAVETGGFVVGRFTVGRTTGLPVLPLAYPIRDDEGRTVGVATYAMDLTWLTAHLRERGVTPDGAITVADRDGVILARWPFPERFIGTRIPDTFQHLVRADRSGAVEITSQDGTRRVIGYVPAGRPPTGVYVSVGVGVDDAYAAIDRATRQGLLLMAGGLALALAAAWWAGGLFVRRPVEALLRAAAAWRAGDLRARTGLDRRRAGEFGVLAEAFDGAIAELGRREAALKESEARSRLALDAGGMGTWSFDLATRTGSISRQAAALVGLPPEDTRLSFDAWTAMMHPEDVPLALAAVERAVSDRMPFTLEFRALRPDGGITWLSSSGIVERAEGGPVRLTGVMHDITAAKETEAQQRLLLDELNHRVKNTLATVQSIAQQTLRTAPSAEAFARAFEARLIALSRTHDLLTRHQWQRAELRALVEAELAPYGRERARATASGPSVRLPPRAALALGLVLHELVTNAAKYGALSGAEGRVDVSWRLEGAPGSGDRRLHLIWRESGGPPVETPSRRGFGSRLVERSIRQELAGEVTMAFDRDGLTCTIAVPLLPDAGDEAAAAA